MSKRKQEIIETSIKLFNTKGCENTSTRHIAHELGISVGNLYYYFKNKEEIIIEIYQELMNEVSKHLNSVNETNDLAFDFYEFLSYEMEIERKYKFIRLELNALYLNYPRIKAVLEEGVVQKTKEFNALFTHQVKHGYMKELDKSELEFLIANVWTVAVMWEFYWILTKEENEEIRILKGVLNTLYILKPYLTQKGLVESNLLKSIEYVQKEIENEK